jgi:hypothetical protein
MPVTLKPYTFHLDTTNPFDESAIGKGKHEQFILYLKLLIPQVIEFHMKGVALRTDILFRFNGRGGCLDGFSISFHLSCANFALSSHGFALVAKLSRRKSEEAQPNLTTAMVG